MSPFWSAFLGSLTAVGVVWAAFSVWVYWKDE